MHGQWLRLILLMARDALVIAATLGLWALVLATSPTGPMPVALHAFTALMTAFVGYLLHEWGHLLGAWVSGSRFALPTPFETFFLFRFDNLGNSRPQFFAMALGGFASSILMVIFLLLALPQGVLATSIALGLTAAGVAATFIIEVPEFWRVAAGGPIPNGAAFMHPGETRVDEA